MLRSFSSYVLGQWNAIAVFSEERVAKLVHGVLLLYLVVSSVLECYYSSLDFVYFWYPFNHDR